MPQSDLEKLLVQVRRTEKHRVVGAEQEIRTTYKRLLQDLQHFLADKYNQFSQNDHLTYAMLQQSNEQGRFLEEVEQRINSIAPGVKQLIRNTVSQTYEATYNGMISAVKKATVDGSKLEGLRGCTQGVLERAIDNPIAGLTLSDTLEKNRKDIIYEIKKHLGVGLTTGDRYTTMAKRISECLNGDYKKAVRIVRTETHRVQEAGNHDAATHVDKTLKDADAELVMMKTWKTMKDERVRPGKAQGKYRKYDHRKMDGACIPMNEEFVLPSGAKTMAPGQSGVAGEDINCRCYLSYALIPRNVSECVRMEGTQTYKQYEEKEIDEMSQRAGEIVKQYTPNESRWSGKTIIRPDDSLISAGKEWNCDISTRSTTSPHILIHEHLHAHSISYYSPEIYNEYQMMEESAVELLAKEISLAKGIEAIESGYDDMVDVLREINKKAHIEATDLEFAKKLFAVSLPDRTNWLSERIIDYASKGTIEQYMELTELLDQLC